MPRQTYFAKAGDVTPIWYHADADGQIVGRLATKIATVLMGKHRPEYTPHVDCGDFVIVTNAAKAVMTGSKAQHKIIQRYTGYPGGRRTITYEEYAKRHSDRLLERAITRMLPKTKLGRQMASKLKVYPGPDHPHQAQQPVALK